MSTIKLDSAIRIYKIVTELIRHLASKAPSEIYDDIHRREAEIKIVFVTKLLIRTAGMSKKITTVVSIIFDSQMTLVLKIALSDDVVFIDDRTLAEDQLIAFIRDKKF
jgi:hypothetical protein